MNQVFNHLWQSTAFAAAVALACTALRLNSPRLRYWLWLSASLKFLIPFSIIVSLGARIQVPPETPSLHAVTVQTISTYFAPLSAAPAPAPGPARPVWAEWLAVIWLAGAGLLIFRWFRQWRILHLAARRSTRLPSVYEWPVFTSNALLEPGVFGIFRPVILLPRGIADILKQEQLDAVLAHEIHHLRYRDNLTAALHMCVEMLFWFHPLVWWIGAKLVDERERDCDNAVLRQGSRPGDYARTIVRICETYVESPLACATGISGSDLKNRIREIMTWRDATPMTLRAKVSLAAAAVVAASLPLVVGLLRAQTLPPPPAYTYEVVSVRKTAPGKVNVHIGPGPQGGLRTENTSVMTLIAAAYSAQDYQIVGAPGWASSDRFDVMFTPEKAEITIAPGMDPKEIQGYLRRNGQRLQAVLRDRFGLVLRAETHELPVYGLIQAPRGNKLTPIADDKSGFPSIQTNGNTQITASNATMEMLAQQLSMQLRRPVRDETGLKGRYNLKLEWAPDQDFDPVAPGANSPSPGASIFTAITEQLGLKLESKKGPVPVYVVEKIERPLEN